MAAILLLTFGSSALAEPEPVQVDYRAYATCPSVEEFLDEIKARTSLVRFVEEAAGVRRIKVVVHREGARSRGLLAVVRGDQSGTPREIVADSCSTVVSALALVAALAIDPHASTAPAPELRAMQSQALAPGAGSVAMPLPATTSTTDVSAVAPAPDSSSSGPVESAPNLPPRSTSSVLPSQASAAPPAAPASRDRSSLPGAFLGGIRATASVWPDAVSVPFGSASVSAEWDALGQSLWSPSVRASFSGAASPIVPATTGQIGFWLYSGAVDLCPIRVTLFRKTVLRPCAGLELGEITAKARGDATYTHPRPAQKLRWLVAEQVLRVQHELSDRFRLELDATLTEPLERYEFIFQVPQDASIAKVPAIIPSVGAGVALRFW